MRLAKISLLFSHILTILLMVIALSAYRSLLQEKNRNFPSLESINHFIPYSQPTPALIPSGFQNIQIPGFPDKLVQIPAGPVQDLTIFNMLGGVVTSTEKPITREEAAVLKQKLFFLRVNYGNGLVHTQKIIDLRE